MLYVKLALSNIKKSFKDYTVYFITLILAVAMFYSFNTMGLQAQFLSISSQKMAQGCEDVIKYITIFVAIILGSLMVYANNYLVKRRKKELGLYQVLGMRKMQVSNILVIETLFASLASFVIGLLLGVLVSQLMVFLTASFFRETIIDFNFIFSVDAFVLTLKSFGLIFLVMLVFNLKTLNKVALVDLMGAHRKNESFKVKNGVVTTILFFVSLGLLGWSYARLKQHGYEVMFGVGAMKSGLDIFKNEFFQTTIMMLVGTVLFFYSVASAYLKLSQLNKSHYLSGLNMFTTRQLSAKAATVTSTMTAISLLLFFSISTITFGMSMAGSMEQMMSMNVPYDVTFSFFNAHVVFDNEDNVAPKSALPIVREMYDIDNGNFKYAEIQDFTENCFDEKYRVSLKTLADATGVKPPSIFETASSGGPEYEGERVGCDAVPLSFMRESDYISRCEVLGVDPIKIGEGQYLIAANLGKDLPKFYDEVLKTNAKINVLGHELSPATDKCLTGKIAVTGQGPVGLNMGNIIVKDNVIPADTVSESSTVQINQVKGEKVDFDKYNSDLLNDDSGYSSFSVSSSRECYLNAVGNLAIISYISIYVGLVMVMAFAAIISIQQLSFAVDSQNSFEMLSKLGCPRSMSNKSLFKQSLIYFSLPMIVGVAHSYVALRVLFKDMSALWPVSLTGSAIRIISVFLILYVIYFVATYSAAKSIVNSSE